MGVYFMTQINMLQAKTELSKLIVMLENKEEEQILIARNGVPVARLSLYTPPKQHINLGMFEGKYDIPDDIDACNDDVLTLMGGE